MVQPEWSNLVDCHKNLKCFEPGIRSTRLQREAFPSFGENAEGLQKRRGLNHDHLLVTLDALLTNPQVDDGKKGWTMDGGRTWSEEPFREGEEEQEDENDEVIDPQDVD